MKNTRPLNNADIFKGCQTKAVETHAHTKGGSPCAQVSAHDTVKAYADAGYGALMITNHFNEDTVPKPGLSPREAVDRYVDLFKEAEEYGHQFGIDVWFGIETCISGGPEDFLLFGADPDILYENPFMYHMTQEELFKECEQFGCLLFQAHPNRSYCKPRDPELLHGAEVYNGNPRHDSHNELTALWAKKYRLLPSSGTDFHQPEDIARGGIMVPEYIKDVKAFASYLRENEVTLITN